MRDGYNYLNFEHRFTSSKGTRVTQSMNTFEWYYDDGIHRDSKFKVQRPLQNTTMHENRILGNVISDFALYSLKWDKYLELINSDPNLKKQPETINIRADKGFMLNSIEVRQPFLSKNLVEFLCALPSKFRVSKNLKGKIFLRNEVAKISKIVSQYKKIGFGKNLISDDKIFKKLEPIINDTINDKKIMQKLNFKKGAEKTFLKSNRSQKYMVFSLIRSLKNLKN